MPLQGYLVIQTGVSYRRFAIRRCCSIIRLSGLLGKLGDEYVATIHLDDYSGQPLFRMTIGDLDDVTAVTE